MEIEAKFVVLAQATEDHLKGLDKLGSYDLHPAELHELHDTYFDTSDYGLLASGYAYRRRIDGDVTYVTLKGLGDVHGGALHHREETEVILRHGESVPPNAVEERLTELGIQDALYPLFELQQTRLERPVLNGERQIGTLALDSIQFSSSAQTVPFTELEFELDGEGTDHDLEEIVNLLNAMAPLSPEPVSKFSRGLILAVGCKTLRASGAYALCEDDTIADTAHKLIHALICKLLLHEFGTYRGEDVEALHDMRVTARRLRTAVRIFRPYLENGDEVEEAVHRLAKGFKRLTKAMGPVRDLDVFRQRTEREFINSNAEEASLLDSLARAWDTAYVPARNYLACYLESPRHKDFKTTLLTSLTSALTAPEAQGPVLEIIPDILETRLCAIQTWAEAAEDPNAAMDTLHSLRLEIKRLRYTLEFFRPLLNPAADRAIEHLIRAQDHLGDLQDTTFSYRHWQAVRSWGMWDLPDQPETLWRLSKPEPLPMASLYLETECQAMERLRTGVPEMWAESAPVFTEAVTTIIEIMRDKVSKIRYNHTH